jgi:hypothetical protein
MSLGVLESPTSSLEGPPGESLGVEVDGLFEEARRRRRRRVLLGTAIACVTLTLVLAVALSGGAGRWFGGPPSPPVNRGPAGGATVHPPSAGAHTQAPRGPSLCGKGVVFLVPRNRAPGASLLPCYRAPTLPGGVATTPTP